MADYYKTNYYIGNKEIIIDTHTGGKTVSTDNFYYSSSGSTLHGTVPNSTIGTEYYDFSSSGDKFSDATKSNLKFYEYGTVCAGGSPNLEIDSGVIILTLKYNGTDTYIYRNNGTTIKTYSNIKLDYINMFIAICARRSEVGGSNEGAGGGAGASGIFSYRLTLNNSITIDVRNWRCWAVLQVAQIMVKMDLIVIFMLDLGMHLQIDCMILVVGRAAIMEINQLQMEAGGGGYAKMYSSDYLKYHNAASGGARWARK